MNRLRLRRRSTVPTPSPTEVQVFADASGVLKAQASNGDISPIGNAAQAGADVTDGDASTVVAASVIEFPGATVTEPVAGTARVETNGEAGAAPDVSDGGSVVVTTPEVIEFPDAVVDEPSPGVARVTTQGGSQPQIVNGYDRVLTVKAREDGDASIFAVGAGGAGIAQMTPDAAGFYDWFAIWEPLLRRKVYFGRYDNESGHNTLQVLDTVTGVVTALTAAFDDPSDPSLIPLAFSPDGATLYASDYDTGDVWTLDADGSNPVKIITDVVTSLGVSPDSTQIVYVGTGGISVADADGSNSSVIVTGADVGDSGFVGVGVAIGWGRDDRIVFCASITRSAVNYGGVYSCAPDGTDIQTLREDVRGAGVDHIWYGVQLAPDGNRFLAQWWAQTAGAERWLTTLDKDGHFKHVLYPGDWDLSQLSWGYAADAPSWDDLPEPRSEKWWINENGYEVLVHGTEPADGDIQPGEVFSWFDATNGAAKYNRKGKTLDGTVVVVSSAMAPP